MQTEKPPAHERREPGASCRNPQNNQEGALFCLFRLRSANADDPEYLFVSAMVCLGVLKGTPIVEECDLLNLQRYIYYKYQIMIFVFLINFTVHSFSHQAQPEPRRALI
ncbi:hypothetical protein, partial [uncultured Mitsuokella sp.]|uniref:hypothetical protein n=1 Tax=uncultured Mitsuokella sp. TaxID=453120 RepID=UPI00265D4A4E